RTLLYADRLSQRIIIHRKNNDRGSDEHLSIFNTVVRRDAQHRVFDTVGLRSIFQQYFPTVYRNVKYIPHKVFTVDSVWSFNDLKFAIHTAHLDSITPPERIELPF